MQAFDELMSIRGLGVPTESINVLGADPVLSTRFALGETSADIMLAIGVAINDLWELRTGQRQDLQVRVEHAAAALRSYLYLVVDDSDISLEFLGQVGRQGISTPHLSKDGRFFLPHMGLPHLAEKILKILDCPFDLESVVQAVARWDALELENAVAEVGACGAMVRSSDEWLAHSQGMALASRPVIEIIKIGESDPEALRGDSPARPLSGLRTLDLTRILAGPTCARTLAEQGADVLMVTAEHLPQTRFFVVDTSHGKRTTFLDFNDREQKQTLLDLVKQADVFSQGYRPGVMSKHGLSPEDLAEIRPGIVYTSMNCYGYDGPFADRAGWEQLAQTVTGIAAEQGGDTPALVPAAACDYTTGYLAAYGTMLALGLRAREGGSYHVRTSLCQSGMFIQRQHRVDYDNEGMEIDPLLIEEITLETQTPYGKMKHLGPVLRLSDTPARWVLPSSPLGTHDAVWL